MTTHPLDVLLLESRPGAGEAAGMTLAEAGHRVHRCYPSGEGGFGCRAVLDGSCPLDGHVDAALLARDPGDAGPTIDEAGVRCALRAGVPLVAVEGEGSGPASGWATVTTRGLGVDMACRRAVALARRPVAEAVEEELRPVLREAGLSGEVHCRIESRWPRLRVAITVDGDVDPRLEQRLGVRAYDVVRGAEGDHRTVDLDVVGLVAHPV